MEQYHTIKFYIKTNENQNFINTYHNIFVMCDGDELYCKNGGGGFSLYLNNSLLSLDFNVTTKMVENFGGSLSLIHQENRIIDLPTNIVNGILYVDSDNNFLAGCGWRMCFNQNIIYDKNNNRLLLGDYDKSDKTFKIFGNLYVQLTANKLLKSILITNL